MTSDVPLDYAVFQLSPKRSRCELFVSYDGTTEKLASGLVKPFVSHLKVAEEQVASAVKSIKLEVERYKNEETWFTKGTLERFVRFVTTPEVLEMVNTFDAEMSQLEAARRIYAQGAGDQHSSASGGDGTGATAASDATKKELLRAIDVRLGAVKQDLTTACTRAFAAGFNPETVSELQLFANRFGAHRLSEACSKFTALSQRRPELFINGDQSFSDKALRSSTGSDMSLDDPSDDHPKPATCQLPTTTTKVKENHRDSGVVVVPTTSSSTSTTESEDPCSTQSSQTPKLTRRLSVQERISLFENKQKENSPSTATTTTTTPPSSASGTGTGVKSDLRRLPSDVANSDKAVLRRWSGSSDMSIDVSGERKESESNANTPKPSSSTISSKSKDDQGDLKGEKDHHSKHPIRARFGGGSQSEESPKVVQSRAELGFENQSNPNQTQFKDKEVIEKSGFDGQQGEVEEVPRSHFGENQRIVVSEVHSQSVTQNKGGEGDMVPAQPRWRSLGGDIEKVGKKESESFETQPGNSGKSALESQEMLPPVDQVSRVRQAKGNQGLNNELKMKANELEKLFAEHKLRVPGDQSNSSRRTRPIETPKEQEVVNAVIKKPPLEAPVAQMSTTMKMEAESSLGSSNMEKYKSTPLMKKTADNVDYDVTPKQNIYSLSFSDDSKGKLYQKYMQKRDAKLRDDWGSKRPEKEAKMKAMQDSLEKSRAEMAVKLAGSADKRNSVHDAHRRAEKLRSFNVRSAMKREKPTESFISDDDEDQGEFLGKKLSDAYLGDSSSKSAQNKKVLPNKTVASSTPRNSTAPVHRSSRKAPNSTTGRPRLNSDNPLAQSVPNFSELRKENTKPSSGGSKPVRPLGRNHARKKSSGEDLPHVNEEKTRKSQSLKKGAMNPIELTGSHNSDDFGDSSFMPSKYDKEETFLRKGSIGRSKSSVMVEAVRNGHDYDDGSFGTEEMMDVAKDDEDDFEITMGLESADLDNGKRRLSQESAEMDNDVDNSNSLRCLPQASPLGTELRTSMPSLFRAMGDSPGESPGSWNARVNNPFSFANEISDIDASDSPIGSPASWNFHTLAQTEAEASRMRKRWGSAQKQKDVTKGLKRFLKFGRKNRASESLADWISATTSEGDDDTEDGRDISNRSSEDLRKSRMGFSHSHHSDDGFNESDIFNEQVHALQSSIPTPPTNFKLREEHLSGSSLKAPKSFFSLSNFRSKGSDSKPR